MARVPREKETVGRESSHIEESVTGDNVFGARGTCIFKII